MGDSSKDGGKLGVPSWQLKPPSDSRGVQKEEQDTASRPFIEDARRFLLEDEVRDAPTDKQIAFLEGKGFKRNEIDELLGVTRNTEATDLKSEPLTPSGTSSKYQAPTQPPETSPTPLVEPSRDVPPIITYPEFLVVPTHPAPLITARRLLATLYLFGGLSALLYGTNHYLITPMIAALTSSRHELAGSAQENLNKLITKLQGMVSETPKLGLPSHQGQSEDEDSDSDPTELFHRDIGVQTSSPTSPFLSGPASPQLPTTALADQTTRLERITSHIKDLNEASISEGQDISDLSNCINVLREYLDGLAYVSPPYSYVGSNIYSGASQRTEAVDDEIARVKAQIISVKGVLLNARSFPAGTWQGRPR